MALPAKATLQSRATARRKHHVGRVSWQWRAYDSIAHLIGFLTKFNCANDWLGLGLSAHSTRPEGDRQRFRCWNTVKLANDSELLILVTSSNRDIARVLVLQEYAELSCRLLRQLGKV